jgi:DUF4097 and DUF4098 domain-containing protein YvlB
MRDRPSLTVTTSSGRVVITGEDRPDIVVDGKAAIEDGDDGGVMVRASSSSLDVRCPAGTDVRVGTSSGGVELRGRLGDARVTTSSSSIRVEDVDALELRSSSGSIEVGTCVGYCRLQTASGSVTVDDAGDVDISTKSSSIRVGRAAGGKVHSVSGSIELGATGVGDLEVRSISGSVKVTLPEGARPRFRLRSVSGKIRCDCDEGDDGNISIATTSGSIQVEPD